MVGTIFIGDAVFCAAIGFLTGVLTAGFGWNIVAVGGMIFVAWIAGLFFQGKSLSRYSTTLAVIFLGIFFAGVLYYHAYLARQAATMKFPAGKAVMFSAIVTSEPSASAKYLLFDAQLEKPYMGTITIFAPPGGDFNYGDEVRVAGPIEPPQTPGDLPAAFPKKIAVLAEHRGFWLREKLIDFKALILEKFNETLPSGDEAALLGGETLGGTDGMSLDLKNQMSASGTSYITAMYGYKMFVIAGFIEAALANFVFRRARLGIALSAVVLFVIMAGGGASVVRGAIMGALGLLARNTGRVFSTRNAMVFTAAAMALWDPAAVSQPVFLLSFLSVIGMAYLTRPIEKLLRWEGKSGDDPNMLDWREAIVVAAASLLPIIPIIVASFGDFSLSSFPSNALIALPLSAVTFFGFILALTSFIAPWLAFFIAQFAHGILLYQLAVIKIFAVIVIPLPAIFNSPIVSTVYYVALVWFAYAYRQS